MNRLKSSAIPILLVVIFGLAFAAGIKSLNSRSDDKGGEGASASTATPGKLNFVGDTETAFAAAKKDGKAVMIKYGAEWCPPCQAMKKEAFNDAGVADLLKNVLVVDIDVDNPGVDSGWLKKQNIGPIPTVQFYDSEGRKIGEFEGYGDIDSFKQDVKKALAKA